MRQRKYCKRPASKNLLEYRGY